MKVKLTFYYISLSQPIIITAAFGATFMFSFYLVVVFLMRTLFTAIVIDTYKREAMKYEKRPPPIVVWSCIGIIGAIIPSCKPRSDIIETDLIHRLPGLSQSMALKLNRFELKTVGDLRSLNDKDLRLFAMKSEFVSKNRLLEFRKAAVQALSHKSKEMMDRRGLPKAKSRTKGGSKSTEGIEMVER